MNSVVPLNITGYHDASSTATDRIHVPNQETLEPMPASAFSPISSSNPPNTDGAVTPTSTHSTPSDSLSVTWPITPQLTVFQNRRPVVRNRPSLSHRRKNIHNLRQMIRKDALRSAQSSNSDNIDAVRVHKVSEAFVRKMPSTNVPSDNGNAVTDSSSAPDSIEIAGWEHLAENGIILAPNSSEIESAARFGIFSDRRASLNNDEVQDITDPGFLGE
ncbi:unnamed protein product [Anisakis simplex]|uniref:Similar to n=1 Tax=Anisakis simplex TaxID=6269 RepID=A0A0M3IZ76_ANISI|nr:unnamed protein product [Anisakis simplex]